MPLAQLQACRGPLNPPEPVHRRSKQPLSRTMCITHTVADFIKLEHTLRRLRRHGSFVNYMLLQPMCGWRVDACADGIITFGDTGSAGALDVMTLRVRGLFPLGPTPDLIAFMDAVQAHRPQQANHLRILFEDYSMYDVFGVPYSYNNHVATW